MKPIGGFLELEVRQHDQPYHDKAIALYTARSCFNLALQYVKPSRVYIPFFTCDSLIEPLVTNKIPYTFYGLNEQFELSSEITLHANEYFLYINYWGLKGDFVKILIERYGDRLIIDNTHSFFTLSYPNNFSFNSPRKIFGVPDGGYLYSPYQINFQGPRNTGFHYDHLIQRWMGNQQESYNYFVVYEKSLNCELRRISLLSEAILSGIDYRMAMESRLRNFALCHEAFESVNNFKFHWNRQDIPFVYPLLLQRPLNREQFYGLKIYLSVFWKEVLDRHRSGFETDVRLTMNTVPLPIDHRYTESDMRFLIHTIKEALKV